MLLQTVSPIKYFSAKDFLEWLNQIDDIKKLYQCGRHKNDELKK